jgi:hypothetical protein
MEHVLPNFQGCTHIGDPGCGGEPLCVVDE